MQRFAKSHTNTLYTINPVKGKFLEAFVLRDPRVHTKKALVKFWKLMEKVKNEKLRLEKSTLWNNDKRQPFLMIPK